jgi:signal transduction histidine kinase
MPSWILLHTHSVIALIIGATQLGMLWILLKQGKNIPIRRWIITNYLAAIIWYFDQVVRFSLLPGTEGSLIYKLETIFIYSPSLALVMLANVQAYYLFIESTFEKERKQLLRWYLPIGLLFVGANVWNEMFNKSNVYVFQLISFLWGVITNIWILIVSIRKSIKLYKKSPDATTAMLWLAFVAFCFLWLSLINAYFGLYSSIGYWTFFIFILMGSLAKFFTYISYSSIFVSFQIKIAGYCFVILSIIIAIVTLVFFPPIYPRSIQIRLSQQVGLQKIMLLLVLSTIVIIFVLPVIIRSTLTTPLKKLHTAIQDVNEGNFSVEVPVVFRDEIGDLTDNFNAMAQTLRYKNTQLLEYTQTLAELYSNQQKVQEQTHNHISQEIHDNVGQMLSLVRIQLNLAAQKNSNENELISEAQENIGRAMMDLRDMAKGMSNDRIKLLGLYASVEQEADRIRRSGICEISLSCSGNVFQFDHQRETILFRVLQECLQNVLKHSEARLLEIFFQYTQDDIQIKIQDNGKGFVLEKSRAGHGLGLMNMQHRIQLMGGEFTINSEPGVGTKIYLQVPFDKKVMV